MLVWSGDTRALVGEPGNEASASECDGTCLAGAAEWGCCEWRCENMFVCTLRLYQMYMVNICTFLRGKF